jgi:hypothetical protein
MEDRVGYLVVCGSEEIKIGLAEQTCIFNGEAQAIIEAIKKSHQKMGNSKKTELKDLLAEESSNLRLMWMPSHMSITGNDRADKQPRTLWSRM